MDGHEGKRKMVLQPENVYYLYMCYCKTLPSYFQESPSYFLYSTTLFEKWNVKYSDTFLVMYVQRILPYVIVHSGTRFSFLRNHFSPTKKFANVWYFIHATFHSKSSKNEKYKNRKYTYSYFLSTYPSIFSFL